MKRLGLFNVVFVFCAMSIMITSCGPTKTLQCSDGPVIVQRHPEKQYNEYVKSTDANIKAGINILDKVKIEGLSIDTKNKVIKLRADLDNFSSRFQDILKASFSSFSTAPCDKDIRKAHTDLLANMAKENSALETLKTNLEKSTNTSFAPDSLLLRKTITDYNNNSKRESIK
jgi:hypothetical protein